MLNIVKVGDPSFANLWQLLWNDQKEEWQIPLYSNLWIKYLKEYAREQRFEDLSFVIEENGRPIIGFLISISVHLDGRYYLSAFGRPILYLESKRISYFQRRSAFKVAKRELDGMLIQKKITKIIYQDFAPEISFFSKYLLGIEAIATPYFTQVIDIYWKESDLSRQIRKSYKSLINWGRKNLSLRILGPKTIKPQDMENFRQLHIQAAGRETRSAKTWDLQYDMVCNKEAFVILGYLEQVLVTAAFFTYNPNYCYYGVSASNRELFDKPLSHSVIWTAILHAKSLGCRYFEMGEQLYPNQGHDSIPTQKELGISTFKRGFGGQTVVRLDLLWKIKEDY
ncbi:MAG: hypothetical protein ACPGWR_00805 [Ardenticatenaceae bacterium]